MAEFLSQAWIEAADLSVAAAKLSASEPLAIQNVVTNPDGSVVIYHVAIDASGARVRAGEHGDPTVVYRFGLHTAAGIAAGELDPYAEFMSGRLEITGDSTALVGHKAVLEALQAAVAAAGASAS